MRYVIAALFLITALSTRAAAESSKLVSCIDAETIALVRVDLRQWDFDVAMKHIATVIPGLAGPIKAFQASSAKARGEFLEAGGSDLVLVVSTRTLPWLTRIHVPLGPGSDEAKLRNWLKPFLDTNWKLEKIGDALVAGTSASLVFQTRPRTELNSALQAAANSPVQVLLLPNDDTRRVVDEVVSLPPAFNANGKTLTRGIRWAALTFSGGAKPALHLTIQSADAASATKLVQTASATQLALGSVVWRGETKPVRELIPKELAVALAFLQPRVKGDQVLLDCTTEALDAVAGLFAAINSRLPGVITADENTNSLKQILLAFHNYHDAFGSLPAHAIYSKDGKPLLSWRVALLPFLENGELYKEFKLDEPWDSEHNRKLIPRMPKVFRSDRIRAPRPGLTTYVVPIGKEVMFAGDNTQRKLQAIPDGTSNTIMLLDVADDHGVIWTKPDDIVIDKKDPWNGLLGHYSSYVLAGFADGSVRRVRNSNAAATLWSAFTIAGGEVINLD